MTGSPLELSPIGISDLFFLYDSKRVKQNETGFNSIADEFERIENYLEDIFTLNSDPVPFVEVQYIK